MIPGKLYKIHGGGDFLGETGYFTFHPSNLETLKNYYLGESNLIERKDLEEGSVMIFISFTKLKHDSWIVTMLLGSEILSYCSYSPERFLKDFTRVKS